MEIYFTILCIIVLFIRSWISMRDWAYIALLISAAFDFKIRKIPAKHLGPIQHSVLVRWVNKSTQTIRSNQSFENVGDSSVPRLLSLTLFTSAHLVLLHAAIHWYFSSCFGTANRIVNCLIGHCCIVTKMYYFHVFLSPSVLALSRDAFLCAHNHIQSACCEQSLFRLSGQIHTKLCQNGRPD